MPEQVQHARLGVVGAAEQRAEIEQAEQPDAGAVVDAIDERAVVDERRAARQPEQVRARVDSSDVTSPCWAMLQALREVDAAGAAGDQARRRA